jgi:putative transposase
MKKSNDIRTGRHCVFSFHVHFVFVTKYRKSVFDADAIARLKVYFANVCKNFNAELAEADGEKDHVHLLVNYPPDLSVSKLVNCLKGVSSRLLRSERPDIAQKFCFKNVLWSPSYFAASCGGAPISIIKQYIESQNSPTH